MVKGSFAARRAAVVSFALVSAGVAVPAAAQLAPSDPKPLTPLCTSSPSFTCPTPPDGTVSVTVITPITVTPNGDNTTTITGQRQIRSDGRLYVGGIIANTSTFPSFVQTDLANLNRDGRLVVRGATDYVETLNLRGSPTTTPNVLSTTGTSYSVNSYAISSLAVAYNQEEFEYDNGDAGTFSLQSVDPAVIVDNVLGREAAAENGQQVSVRRSRSALVVF